MIFIKISNSFISFNGYKNVVSYDLSDSVRKFAFFTAELTDDQNSKDLTVYKDLLKKNKLPESNTISCFLTHIENNDFIFFNQKVLPNDFVLNDMKYMLPKNEYSDIESSVLKTYSFLASLTKRMAKNNTNFIDKGYMNVVYNLISILKTSFDFDSRSICSLIIKSMQNNKPIGKCAFLFNATIQNIMTKFFNDYENLVISFK